MDKEKTTNIILGVTGSVAAIKTEQVAESLLRHFGSRTKIKILATEKSEHFFAAEDFREGLIEKNFEDRDEWRWISPKICCSFKNLSAE